MTQAARSGKQNIVEGFVNGVTSIEMELKLLNVARASLNELKEDYTDYLGAHKLAIWDKNHPRYKGLLKFCSTHNKVDEYKDFFAKWTDEEFANCANELCRLVDKMMSNRIDKEAEDFEENGGIRERMTAARLGRRQSQNEEIAALKAENTRLKSERRRIEQLFTERYYVPTDLVRVHGTTFKDEAEGPFRTSCFRGTSTDIDDLFSRCAPHWSKGDLESLLLYCEVITNIAACVNVDGCDSRETKAIRRQILENIHIVLEKTGHELRKDEKGVYFIVQKNAIATDVIHEIDDKHLALAILEYNRFSLKGEIDRKRELLNVIGQAVEPILKDKSARAQCPEVYDDVRFALNRLNIRHNNEKGANEQPTFKELSKKDLETAYDDLYSSMLVLLKVSQLQEGHARMDALKKQMTKV